MKDIAIEWETYSTKNITLTISGKDIGELFQELENRKFNPQMQGEYEFSVIVSQDVFSELGSRQENAE